MSDEPSPIRSARKDEPHISSDWERSAAAIDGVVTREVKHVVTFNGTTTEVFRKDWGVMDSEFVHMIHVSLRPGAVSAWHMHEIKTDHLFTVGGHLQIALYDDREGSPTRGRLQVEHTSPLRPTLVVIPPGVWHGIKVLSEEPGTFINYFDDAYDYDNPDDWRLPADTDEIPHRF